jgi:hypothetical protein
MQTSRGSSNLIASEVSGSVQVSLSADCIFYTSCILFHRGAVCRVIYQPTGQVNFMREVNVVALEMEYYPPFIELKSLVLCPQVRTTGPHPDPHESGHTFCRVQFHHYSHIYSAAPPGVLFRSYFSTAVLCAVLFSTSPTLPMHLLLLDCMTLVFG